MSGGVRLFEVAYETTFCATHVLHRDGQPIEPQHGHDWRVEVVATGETLDGLGVVVDFEHLKQAVAGIAARFHYGDITSHPDFAGQSPSAEAVARYFFRELRGALGPEGERLVRVRVWEAPGCSASYSE
jgi:6-pyruvoyltetrahydropterin/6-carboxytetrahydropterin synthase